MEEIIIKGDKATSEEKQKTLKYIFDLYSKSCQEENISKKGKNLEKISQYLNYLGEEEKKDILSNLKNNFPDYEEFHKKLVELISKKYSIRPKIKFNKKKLDNNLHRNIFNIEDERGSTSRKKDWKIDISRSPHEFSKSLKIKKRPESHRSNNQLSKSTKFGKIVFGDDYVSGRRTLNSSLLRSKYSEPKIIRTFKNFSPLKFDSLFLEFSKFEVGHRQKNPFLGPSPFDKYYKIRKSRIKKKINNMANVEIKQFEK